MLGGVRMAVRRFAAAAAGVLLLGAHLEPQGGDAVHPGHELLGAHQADYDRPPTHLHVRYSAASYGVPYTAGADVVPPGASLADAVQVGGESADFRWFFHAGEAVQGPNPTACVFTADRGADGRLTNIGGGRNCGGGPSEQCAYIAEGYHVFAVSGLSCTALGVPLCGGLFC